VVVSISFRWFGWWRLNACWGGGGGGGGDGRRVGRGGNGEIGGGVVNHSNISDMRNGV
jgi:hypothetical protein